MIKYVAILMTFTALCTANVDKKEWEEIHGNNIYTEKEKQEANKKVLAAETNLRSITKVATETNLAIRAIVKVSSLNLRRKGYYAEASQLESEWKQLDGKIVHGLLTRSIGDFEPISEWLALSYEMLEAKLGLDLCETLRLTDIKTLNYCIKVCFQLCKYGYTNFYDHFVTDNRYKGLAPVVAYWTTVITCDIASYGAGYFFVCSPIGMLVERAVLIRVGPWLAPKVFDRTCGA